MPSIRASFVVMSKSRSTLISVISSKDRLAAMLEGADDEIQINVKLGSNEEGDFSKDCSFVTATYSAGGKNLGTYGVIGPIRMDYTKVITVLENVGKVLEDIVNARALPESDAKGTDKDAKRYRRIEKGRTA